MSAATNFYEVAKGEASACADSTASRARPESDKSTELGSEPSSDSEQELSSEAGVPEGTLFLFDWDDTILPTTWLEKLGALLGSEAELGEEHSYQLQALASRTVETLEAAERTGQVVLVTNAIEGWVEYSCMRFLPALAPVLQRVRIVSARSAYEPLGARSPTEWKCRAFESEARRFLDELGEGFRVSIVSIGDAEYEHQACVRAARGLPQCYAKLLKFAEHPTVEQLAEEHLLVMGTLEDVAEYQGDLDIAVETSV